jgi:quercetin dioxygenase-like cupin family protein
VYWRFAHLSTAFLHIKYTQAIKLKGLKMKFTIKATTLALALSSAVALSTSFTSTTAFAAETASRVVAADDIEWGYLNPLRGDKSPGAADLWGDRTKNTATGMLVRFNKGFESPPHIHNITYRGIVIEGAMHNDDPTAGKMWMPAGSFWTQPAGEDHTTAANGSANLIYLEIDSGPYLVQPSSEHFDNGERPLNLHKDNIVWLNDSELHDVSAPGVSSTYVWGSAADMNGSMVKLPVGFNGSISTDASEFRAVVIAGEVKYQSEDVSSPITLSAGSYVESTGAFEHQIVNEGKGEATIYIRTDSDYQVR